MIEIPIERREPVMRWIPCSERLPKNGGEVLITVKWNRGFDDDYEVTLGEFWAKTEGWGDWEDGEVLAWMPLPEPWREEEKENV